MLGNRFETFLNRIREKIKGSSMRHAFIRCQLCTTHVFPTQRYEQYFERKNEQIHIFKSNHIPKYIYLSCSFQGVIRRGQTGEGAPEPFWWKT